MLLRRASDDEDKVSHCVIWALDETYPHIADQVRHSQHLLGEDRAEVDGAKQWQGALSPEFFFLPSINKDGKLCNFYIKLHST